ncbi:MAG: DNA polymerase III subunit epsilon [Devosia sp.]|nr:DNA polymerase III subunit epsilon [Devosia sp.]
MKREIVLDTETTGLNPLAGDRIVEIGCVELINHIPSGRHFHRYINPERPMPEEAFKVHGLSDDFLRDKPRYHEVAHAFDEFVGEATLIIHNAAFDIGFLNAEHARAKRPSLANPVIDTVELARRVHPGARVSLDALCKHYGIDNSKRTLHGALLDSEILAEVYLELIGGRQVGLALTTEAVVLETGLVHERQPVAPRPVPLPSRLDSATRDAHAALLKTLGPEPLWLYYEARQAAE